MTWLDKGLRQIGQARPLTCIAGVFDMTWLDKGLRRATSTEIAQRVLFDMTWLDKGLRRREFPEKSKGTGAFDMTWLDKGLRRTPKFFLLSANLRKGLIWPDLIRDYDACISMRAWSRLWQGLIWPDLIRDYDSGCAIASGKSSKKFDMTWLDKGLRRASIQLLVNPSSWVWYDLTW